jgi:hypothetical protein
MGRARKEDRHGDRAATRLQIGRVVAVDALRQIIFVQYMHSTVLV